MTHLSVIVPIYNNYKYLNKCFESIINQSFKDFECILVCDGDDKDIKICENVLEKDFRFSLIKYINKGLGGARNAGLMKAKGKYICFLDSDDYIEKDLFEKILKCFNETDTDIVIFDTNIISGENNKFYEKVNNYISLKYTGIKHINYDCIFNTNVNVWNKAFKKEIIEKYNIRFIENSVPEDFPFYFHYMFACKKAYYLREKLYNYVQRSDSGMTKIYNHDFLSIKGHIDGCVFLYKKLQQSNLLKKNMNCFLSVFFRWFEISICYCDEKDKKSLVKYSKEKFIMLNLNKYILWPNAITQIYYVFSKITFRKCKKYYKNKRSELKFWMKNTK